jgi:peptidylglycine monooxygenase
MLVFKTDGTILDSWGCVWPGGHGLTLSRENGEEFLFVTDSGLWKSGTAWGQTTPMPGRLCAAPPLIPPRANPEAV